MTNWTDKNILILGAARQGLALARYLTKHGAKVTLNDKRMPNELKDEQDSLKDIDVEWMLGAHFSSLLNGKDLVCLSGGIPLNLPIVRDAQRRKTPLSNDTQIFLEDCPCRTIGITGSAGKTTTTTIVGRIAKEAFRKSENKVWVGGNIGDPLLNYVDEMKEDDLAILEISSFQLDQISLSTNIAALLNVTPNHLDRHGTMEAYAAAKARLLQNQKTEDIAIIGREDEGAWSMAAFSPGKMFTFGSKPLVESESGTYPLNDYIYFRDERMDIPLIPMKSIHLRGNHNLLNVLAAATIAFVAGFPPKAMEAALEDFHGVEHRLELVREWKGAAWYNNSIATAPERVMAAVRSFDEPIVLMLGGRDKKLPWGKLAELIRQRVDHVVLFGEAAQKIAAAMGGRRAGERPYTISHCIGLEDAVEAAAKVAEEGDVILLSPGGTSFDEFKDFAQRGESFRKWVLELS
ncbi:MAG: UDP-N-acetylmuramoyl-L-alanine--D-glutamate ligase [Anaerolineae bacterium]|jgi:UDP-N-acetylmuramoylalanine--D-glutamate ligase|nr:UDP-N-acetylmuramoyl-L-alanine--D-glutamate ligase [Anaerolineae bacterium]MBT4310704.1 UDP-N-acetylmuramoyl-L-alanine--D-glutamate ligase [Anaerolineae bacterium]MBT4457880.1 UDP-N-acetylmuramoyl-L-alanine--D-glutamate ligase [Anaerolineae bacterium]MBT4842069.1 UDP-N-acetylmuramoyl-L-alanine--D-glutamate ligase [Anaerolineae bacterium]MBT6060298.1 UDP-N-acetylmuramoyl-L-alanine--D-glutamate ligase [Anaerolineae bacterium]